MQCTVRQNRTAVSVPSASYSLVKLSVSVAFHPLSAFITATHHRVDKICIAVCSAFVNLMCKNAGTRICPFHLLHEENGRQEATPVITRTGDCFLLKLWSSPISTFPPFSRKQMFLGFVSPLDSKKGLYPDVSCCVLLVTHSTLPDDHVAPL